MEQKIEILFQLYLRSEEFAEGRLSEEERKREYQLSKALYGDFSDEKNSMLNECIMIQANRHFNMLKRAYAAGFREGQKQNGHQSEDKV